MDRSPRLRPRLLARARLSLGHDDAVTPDPELVSRAWRRWWFARLLGLLLLVVGITLFVLGAMVLVQAGEDADGQVALAFVLGFAGFMLGGFGVLLAPKQLGQILHARHTVGAHPWRRFEGQLLKTTWTVTAGEGTSQHVRWALIAPDDTYVLLDRRVTTAALDAVVADGGVVWVSGPLDRDPVLLLLEGPDLETTQTVRTERQRLEVQGRHRKKGSDYRTERSPRLG